MRRPWFPRPTIEQELAEIADAGFCELRERAARTIERLCATHPQATTVAVTHAGVIVPAMIALVDIPRPGTRAFLEPAHASITEWSHDGTRWTLERYNDRAHLA